MVHRGVRSSPLRSALRRVDDLVKQRSLHIPIDPADNRAQVSLIETLDGRQEEELFLNVRSEVQQLHDLRHAGSRHPAPPGEFRIIPNLFLSQQSLKPDGQCHEPSDSGSRVTNHYWLRFDRANIECVCDFLSAAHSGVPGSANA